MRRLTRARAVSVMIPSEIWNGKTRSDLIISPKSRLTIPLPYLEPRLFSIRKQVRPPLKPKHHRWNSRVTEQIAYWLGNGGGRREQRANEREGWRNRLRHRRRRRVGARVFLPEVLGSCSPMAFTSLLFPLRIYSVLICFR